MAQDYMGNYTSSPNADILQLLSAQNEAAANRAARLYDGGTYSGSGSNVSIQEIMGAMGQAQDGNSQQRAQDALAQRVAMREQMGLDRSQANWQMEMQKAAMEEVARKKMDLNLQEVALNAQLASASGDSRQALLDELDKLEQMKLDINSRELGANSLLVQRNSEAAREFAGRLSELRHMKEAMKEWQNGIDKASNLETFLSEFMANPMKGGMGPQSTFNKVGEGTAGFVEWFKEMGSGDTVADMELKAYLENSPNAKSMLAAASQNKAFQEAYELTGWKLSDLLGDTNTSTATNKLTAQFLSDLFTRSLVNSGTALDVPGATRASEKLIGEMIDLSTSANIKPEEMSARMHTALKEASGQIFGSEGDKALPKLAEALDKVLSKAGMLSGQMSAEIRGEKGRIGLTQLQNAAAGHMLGQASSLRNVLRTGVAGKIMTADQLSSALGYTEGVYNADTRQLDVGLLPLGEGGERERLIRMALGEKESRGLEELMALSRKTQVGSAQRSTELVDVEAKLRRMLMRLQEGGPADNAALKTQAEILAKKLAELRSAPPVKYPAPPPIL